MPPDKSHRIRHQVQLPSGKQIEVVYLDRANRPAAEPVRPPKTDATDPLHICSRCAGELVYPLDWIEESPGRWRLLLRCPDCERTRHGVFSQGAVQRLDDELDRATGALLGDLKRMTYANMADEIEFFVRALDADLIGPSDF
jgi:hypothetical protein